MEILLTLAALVLAALAFNRAARALAEVQGLRDELEALKAGARQEKESRRQTVDDGRWAPPGAAQAARPQPVPAAEEKSAAPGIPETLAAGPAKPAMDPFRAPVTRIMDTPAPARAAPPPLPLTVPGPDAVRETAARKEETGPPPPSQSFQRPAAPRVDLEQFMGAKLFAWIGGLALFLGVLFFVKLSFERGWVSPAMRVTTGLLGGLGLMLGGMLTHRRRRYAVLGQTLCATGVVMLYGVAFAAHALYQLGPFASPAFTFAVMSVVTAAAFVLAVRMQARVVAVLGMLGGFLTPPLCSTGQDQALALFSYIALLDAGVLAVVRHRRWLFLAPLAALGTVLMQLGWLFRFIDSSGYASGAATAVPVGVFLGFGLLFTVAVKWVGEAEEEPPRVSRAALGLLASAMLPAFIFSCYVSVAARPLVLFGFVLGINALAFATLWLQPRQAWAHRWIVGMAFLHLASWTVTRLNPALLYWALGIYLVFGLLHTAFSTAWLRRGLEVRLPAGWMPVMTLVLVLMSVQKLDAAGLGVWPVVLLVDLLVIVLAARSGSVAPVFAALVLTLLTAAVWFLQIADHRAGEGGLLGVAAAAGLLFSVSGAWLVKKLPHNQEAALLPGASAIMPFVLLILATMTTYIPEPSPVFAVALLLVFVQLALARWTMTPQLAAAALICSGLLQSVWHAEHFSTDWAVVPLLWAVEFHLVFITFAHLFRRAFAASQLPWITAAVSGLVAYRLVHPLVAATWPNGFMGLLPAVFSLPPLLMLHYVARAHSPNHPARLGQMAWLGGVGLFFITLIFPVQFERQWITLGWALEGAALCWLYLRVPHPGLRLTGAGLLVLAFIRLALNPAVLSYHARGDIMLLNWQLYAYSVTALALFTAARLLRPPHHAWLNVDLRALFISLGGILLFLLVNIEIADAFTPPGSTTLVLSFSGNTSRDMTYTIAWAVFALALITLGLWKRARHARYAGIGLLAVAVLKLFLHDLASIDSVYRIGALIAVAVIALAASWLYQRFLGDDTAEDG